MKKIISILIALLISCSLTACGQKLEDYQKQFFIDIINNTDHDIQGIRYKIDLDEDKRYRYESDYLESYMGEGYAFKVGEKISVAQCGQPDKSIKSFKGFEMEIYVMETDGTVSDLVDRVSLDVEYYREYIFSLTNKNGVYKLELIDTREPVFLDELEKQKLES